MAKLKVLAGDFKKAKFVGGGTLTGNRTAFVFPVPFTLDEFRRRNPDARYDWQANTVTYPMSLVKTLEEVTEENKVRVLGAAGWGAVGAIALGPVGALGAAAGSYGGSNSWRDGEKCCVCH